MKSKKKETEREYRNFFCGWLPKLAERLQIILYNVRDHSDLKEGDWEVLRFFYKNYDLGELPQFMPEINPPKEQNMTDIPQSDLFTVNQSEVSQNVTVQPPTLDFGIESVDISAETKKEKK
jgi:hypothetical protein